MSAFVFQEIKKNESFDPLVICPETPFTQARFYGEWQEKMSREVKRFIVLDGQKAVAFFQLIRYPLLWNKSYFYAPYGPITKDFSEQFLESLKRQLERIAKESKAVFVRLDFTPPIENDEQKNRLAKFFTKAPFYTYRSAHFQPRAEWFLALNKSEDQLLKEMHEKTRYAVRLAGKKGVKTEIVSHDFEKYFSVFYELMLTAAKRNGFWLHDKSYYQNIFQNLRPDNGYLVVARYEEKILAMNLVVLYGRVANYVFGGSSNERRNLMPTYLSHWRAIGRAKKLGAIYYNFGGISFKNIYKNMDGLTVFKKKFGGVEKRHSDFFDVVAQPFWYQLYNFRKLIKNRF